MNQVTDTYAGALIELGVPPEDVEAAAKSFAACPELREVLSSPIIGEEEKERVIARIFPRSMQGFLRLLCRNGRAGDADEIFRDYRSQRRKNIRRIKATVEYVTPLTPAQQNGIVDFVKRKTGYSDVELNLVQNPELLGGFILRAGDFRYDRSTIYMMTRLEKKLRHQHVTEISMTPAEESIRSEVNLHKLKATVEYVTPLSQAQISRIKEIVKQKTRYKDVELNLVQNPELLGGFILQAGNFRYDRSVRRMLAQLHENLKRR
ncbi:MAG: ATP synthase F1 subunit delta [Ruminococcus sp.]|nr:ATP synthase F1 subunit delta [Ruminococcus sp.]